MESGNKIILFPNTAPVLIFFTSRSSTGSKPKKMNKELIMKSDVLDIIFEHRNKSYGAYVLRKSYDSRMAKALGVMLGLATVVSAFAFLPKKETMTTRGYVINDREMSHVKPPEKKLDEPKPKVETPKKPTAAYTSVIKIVKENDSATVIKTITTDVAIGSTNIDVVPNGDPALVTPVATGNTGTTNNDVKPVVDRTRPVDNPEVMPSYPGGMEALRNFLQRNLQNPRDMEEGEEVSVKVRFVVGYDGKLQSFVAANDVDDAFYKEVVRVLKKMPEWIPGKARGENVAVNYVIPVKFVPGE